MSAVLSAIFKGVDEISSVFETMAASGARAVDQWESASSAASNAFEQAAAGAESAAKAMDSAASSADHWTSAVGTYDKAAMEAIYSTEELVELGYKTEDALTAQAKAAEESADALEKSLRVTEDFKATTAELEAELTELQNAYIGTALQYGKNSDEAKALQKEIGELSKVIDQNKKEFADLEKEAGAAGDSMEDSMKAVQSALTAAGIAKLVNEITEAVIEMANEFSDASAVVAKATGATGDALDGLNKSMMNVYSNAKTDDLSSVAGAIGEINTRLGLTGPELDHVTSLFMDYSQITGSEVVGAVQNVTKVMKNWGVEVSDTESLLDKLSAAGQMSGISVDQLSNLIVQNKATLQQLGYGLDESIALLSMFEYEGLNSSSIMMGFRSAVTGFTNDGKDASVAMQEVIEQIANMASESDATALAVETFGSRAGAELAFAIRNGKFEIQDWISAVSSADGTLSQTADAATTLEEKWQKASNSISTAFSSVVTPAVDGVSSAFAGIVEKIGGFLQEHPALTTALSVLAGVLVAVTTAIGALLAVFAIKMALLPILTGEVTVFGVALNAAIWPITLIVAAIAALVAIGVVLFNWLNSVDEEWAALSATSKQHYEEVERLNEEYERTVELEGENSEAAQKLAADLEAARAVYEANRMTLEEFVAQNDKLIESQQKLAESYNESMTSINNEEKSSTALISKLAELQSKTSLTASEQQQMSAVVDKLNSQMPGLALTYDKTTGSLNRSVAEMRKMAEAQAEVQRQQKQAEAYAEAIAQQVELEEQLAKAKEQVAAAEENKHGWGWFGESKKTYEDLEAFTAEQERLQAALDENNRIIQETEQAWQDAADAAEEAAQAPVSYEEAVNTAIQSVSEDLNELIQKYDEAYEAARTSLDGTFELFEKVEEKSGVSSQAIIEAWQSQIDFFNEYNENLQKLQEMDLDPKFLEQLSDGSQESAGQVKALMEEIENLSPEAAAARIQEINDKFGELSTAKDNAATTMAEIQTDFNNKLGEIENRMNEAVNNMNMDEEAAAAAKSTISAYISQISSMTGQARSAAEGVARAAASALGGKGISTVGVPGFATGTESAPRGVALVGEEGPELVRFNGGEEIYTADETNQILARTAGLNTPSFDMDRHVSVSADMDGDEDFTGNEATYRSTEEKKITLDINGSGEIDVTGADEETVWEIVEPRLKGAFMGIVRSEIFEEGDRAYAF